MGAWGTGSFENDDGLDWTYDIQSPADVSKVFDRLKAESDAHPDGGDMYIEADFASQLIAAAECVAMMMGRVVPDFPPELRSVPAEAGEPDALLFHQARNATLSVMRNSELAELWQEASESDETNPWLAELNALIERLNPDIDYVPQMPEWDDLDIEEEEPQCAFCRQPVSQKDYFGLSVTEYGDIFESSRVMPIHLGCLNSRLHHKTAVIAFRDDPDRPIDLDKL